jgi:hypothetical protein
MSETVRNRTRTFIIFLLRMTDTMTSQNLDLSSWDILYNYTWCEAFTTTVYSEVFLNDQPCGTPHFRDCLHLHYQRLMWAVLYSHTTFIKKTLAHPRLDHVGYSHSITWMHDASHWCQGAARYQWTKNKGAGLILTVKGHVKLHLQLNSQ